MAKPGEYVPYVNPNTGSANNPSVEKFREEAVNRAREKAALEKFKKDTKTPDIYLKPRSVHKEGGKVPSSDARARGKKYHMGGSVDQMNPAQPTNRMNPNQPANNMGPKPPSGGGNQPMDHEWWGGWRMRGDARPKDPDFTALMKKGGKVKK